MNRVGLAALAIALVTPACGGDGAVEPPPVATRKPQTGDRARPSPTAVEDAPLDTTPGTLEIVVVDGEGRRRADVEVRYRGRGSPARAMFTDARGIARRSLPPGEYDVEVPGRCQKRYVLGAVSGGGRVGLPAGRVVRVRFTAELQRRYAPGTPVTWSREPPWPRGKTIRFTFSLYDRCKDRLSPGVRFDEYRYRASSGLRLLDTTPQRANDDAAATIEFECTAAGDPTLRLEDPQAPEDGTDLLSLRPPFTPGTKWCA